jgi:ABC-type nickel/cobalt efflux system permease component RcnA
LAALLAVALGCLHALAPGHGKTLMAAYVLGEDSRLRQLAALGLTVAATHTMGVLVLGVAVSASTAVAPEAVLTGTSVASGVLLAVVGAGLLARRLGRRPADHHDHAHGHDHPHGHHYHLPRAGSWRVVGMGFAGGLVPSPSALVVLLGATALGRVWFGVLLVVAYGLGMAAALVAAGALLVRARPRLDAWARGPGRLGVAVRALPVLTAGGLLLGGLSLAARSLVP